MPTLVSIVSLRSLSPLGHAPEGIWANYLNGRSFIKPHLIGRSEVPAAILGPVEAGLVSALKDSDPRYKHLDNSVLYAMVASRNAVRDAGWAEDADFGINIGSSRGATDLFEKYHTEFLRTGTTGIQSSPATTLGNVSSWVAQDLKSNGPEISHSITCSTSLHALLNGVAWLRSGMADKFLVGGSEAPLTGFTVAQMQAMKIYSTLTGDFPCRAFDLEKKINTMVLGEGAASACLEPGRVPGAIGYIEGVGYATEALHHSVSLSANADCLIKSMTMALGTLNPSDVDAIVMHAPGTIKGDLSEYNAIRTVFGPNMPLLTTGKWKIGHTFGASGLLSLELALLMIKHDTFVQSPFFKQEKAASPIRKVMVNAIGFGGNAVSVLVSGSV